MRTHSAHRKTMRRALVVVGAAALALAMIPTGSASAAPSRTGGRATLSGSAPDWTRQARQVGAPSSAARISFNVILSLRNPAQAGRLAADVSDPHSASYGHYLSPAQFNARYAPTSAQVHSVESFLASSGLSVSAVAQGNRWVSASGTVSQVEHAFGTSLKTYSYRGRNLRASTGNLSVPTDIAGVISGVLGVSQTASVHHPASITPDNTASTGPADAVPARADCSAFWDQHEQIGPLAYGKTSFPTNNCGYSPSQVRTAYGVQSAVKSGTDGRGVTVAIIDAYASQTIVSDADALSALQGEPALAAGQYSETVMGPFGLQGECGGEVGWNQEETLDVEAVHGLAPGATIHYVGAQDCDTGIDAAVNYVIQNHVANIVSNSYGFVGEDGLGSELALEHSEFTQAAVEGIGFYFSSGDDGDNTIDGVTQPEADYPASDPLVTGVGGTSLAVTPKNGYDFETSWGDDLDTVNFATSPSSYQTPPPGGFLFGGGGGVSALFTEPAYQKLAVPASLAKLNGKTAMRVVPDVAAVADPETGYLIDFAGTPQTIGGTSLACPVFAAVQALASQHRRFPIGFANPLLYVLGLTGATFHDVTAPKTPIAMMTQSGRSLLTMASDSSLTATKGYDDTTGLGSPNGPALLIGETLLP